LAQLKKFKKALLGKETPPDEEEDLNEDSSDAEIRKKLRARVANERTYSALTLTCGEAKSFRIIYNSKTMNLSSDSACRKVGQTSSISHRKLIGNQLENNLN
jgi:hypothetical protein